MNALAETLAGLEDVQEVLRLAEAAQAAALAARDAMIRDLRQGGFSQQETATLLGITKQRVSQIERAGWGEMPAQTASDRLAFARECFQAAKHAQKLREERRAMGYARETAIFYGERDTPLSDEQEQRVRWSGFYQAAGAEL